MKTDEEQIKEVISHLNDLRDRLDAHKNSKAKKPKPFSHSSEDWFRINEAANLLDDYIRLLEGKEAVVDFLSSALEGPMKKLIHENAEPRRNFDDY